MRALRRIYGRGLVIFFAVLLTGCGGISIGVGFSTDDEDAESLPFSSIAPSISTSIADRRLVVIRDISTWDAFWSQHVAGLSPQPGLPVVNFSHEMVIGVFSGNRSNACYRTWIDSIWLRPYLDRIEVNFVEAVPPPNAICATVITNPYALVVVPYSPLPVVFFELG